MLARLRVRICGTAAASLERLDALATAVGRPRGAAALLVAAVSLFSVTVVAALGSSPADSVVIVEVSLAQPAAVIVVNAATGEASPPAPVASAAALLVATVEPTPTIVPAATKTQPVATPVAHDAAAASAATAAPVSAGKQYTAEEVRSFARQAGWPDSLAGDVVMVAVCESGLFSGARGGPALGLMQVVEFWFDEAGVERSLWSDPVANLKVAYYVYRSGISNGDAPWSDWGCKPPPPAPTPAATATPAPPTRAAATASPAATNTALPAAPAGHH